MNYSCLRPVNYTRKLRISKTEIVLQPPQLFSGNRMFYDGGVYFLFIFEREQTTCLSKKIVCESINKHCYYCMRFPGITHTDKYIKEFETSKRRLTPSQTYQS